MESYPQSVAGLASLLDIPVEDLLIPCNFCGTFLTFLELQEFDAKVLTLIWKEHLVYACCRCCCTASGFFEFQHFYEQSVLGRDIETVANATIFQIVVRCHQCLRLLDQIDKLDICGRRQHFHKVRGGWRGRCRFCK
ncbi:early protein E6 [Human papillomavirus 152]|uniref:Protein E6 n=1 Tax=Human papillomavirus 152 TaxID=990302 RepID=W5QK78_9PAPI|nr:early protein E6 [Human papillomavirus 152]